MTCSLRCVLDYVKLSTTKNRRRENHVWLTLLDEAALCLASLAVSFCVFFVPAALVALFVYLRD